MKPPRPQITLGLTILVFGLVGTVRGQDLPPGSWGPVAYEAPGRYGVAWGAASYGVPLTYSAFSSPYGGGYGYGHGPSQFSGGRFGLGLWAPGQPARPPGRGPYGYGNYWTFPYEPSVGLPPVPLGAYAPGFGPPSAPAR